MVPVKLIQNWAQFILNSLAAWVGHPVEYKSMCVPYKLKNLFRIFPNNTNILQLACAHTTHMDIDQLDEKLITEPLSKGQRLDYIKAFINKSYLKGIDDGTRLEQSRLLKISRYKQRAFNKKYESFLDKLEDLINIFEKRVYREKYKGRYNYYKPKKPRRKKPSTYKQQQLW